MDMPAPGWYEDPVDAGGPLRWWDGMQWTEHTAAVGTTAQPALESASRATPDAATAQHPGPAAIMPAPVVPPVPSSAVPSNGDDPSLTDWFQSIPFPVVSPNDSATAPASPGAPARGRELAVPGRPARPGDTQVLERDGTGALAGFGWQHGTPVSADDTPLLERGEAAGVLRRNRTRLMWGVALGTAVAVLITGVLVAVLGSGPAAKAPAAVAHPSAVRTVAPKASAAPSATLSPAATTGTPVTDTTSGLSYATLAAPWQAACPSWMNNGEFSWTAGEAAEAGTIASAGGAPWYGLVCSGLLTQQVAYTGVADLPQTAANLAAAFESTYDSSLPNDSATEQNNPLQVSGHAAWIVEFQQTFQNAAAEGLAWQTQLGAVVVVDRGSGQAPAVLYVSVPNNLNTTNVGAILASLQLSGSAGGASAAATPPAAAATNAAPNP